MHMAFTDRRPEAAWRATYLRSLPWVERPWFADLVGFELAMVVGDLLHIFNLGTAKNVAACVLKIILQDTKIFTSGTIEERMAAATDSLKQFAKQNKYQLRLKKLSKSKIKWQSKKYPELGSSGSDCHVVLAWLETLLLEYSLDCYRDITVLVWSGNQCMKILYAGGWFLESGEQQSVRFLGATYINTYLKLASEAISNRRFLWKVLPKMHILDHTTDSPRKVNPAYYSTWMDEDFLKKAAKVLRLTNVKTAQKRILQRWLLATPANLLKNRNNLH